MGYKAVFRVFWNPTNFDLSGFGVKRQKEKGPCQMREGGRETGAK